MRTLVYAVLLSLLLAAPAVGQDTPGETTHISVNGFSFVFGPDIASHVNVVANPGDAPDARLPNGATPPRREFLLYDDDSGPGLYQSDHQILVFRVADFEPYRDVGSAVVYHQLAALEQLLREQPDLSTYEGVWAEQEKRLPHLPILLIPQMLRARAAYLETDNLRGIRYLAVYPYDTGRPLLTNEFVYAFLALSKDGQWLVTGSFRVAPEGFFSTWPPENPDDLDAFYARFGGMDALEAVYDDFVAEHLAPLNAAAQDSFTPSLDAIDALIESITIE